MLGPLQGHLHLVLAVFALEAESDFLGSLCLLVKDGLSLTTKSLLLAVVTTLT